LLKKQKNHTPSINMSRQDCIDLIHKDHQKVKNLHRKYMATNDRDRKQKIANKIIRELSVHASLEETLIYPVLRDRTPNGGHLSKEAYNDHLRVEGMLDELLNMKVSDNEGLFDSKMNLMIEDLLSHIRQEEGQLLPLLREHLDKKELLELGQKMERNRPLMPTHPHPNMPKEGTKGMIAGLAAAPLDKAYDTARSAVSGH